MYELNSTDGLNNHTLDGILRSSLNLVVPPFTKLFCSIFKIKVSAWGGYVFIINLIPLHVFLLLLMGRYSNKVYTGKLSFRYFITLEGLPMALYWYIDGSRRSCSPDDA